MDNNYEKQQKEQAKTKLDKEMKEGGKSFNRYAAIIAPHALQALFSFIDQDLEFAEAINQNSQTFGDCMAAVTKKIGSSLSDFEAYGRAAAFYFPGAKVEFCMKLHVNPHDLENSKVGETEKETESFKEFSLFDILD